jgi:hypothetical protein
MPLEAKKMKKKIADKWIKARVPASTSKARRCSSSKAKGA